VRVILQVSVIKVPSGKGVCFSGGEGVGAELSGGPPT